MSDSCMVTTSFQMEYALLRALEGILMIRPDYHAGRDDLWLNRGEVERIAREAIALVNGGAK